MGKRGPKPRPLEERFFEKVKKEKNGCWIWTGKLNDNGYGVMSVPADMSYSGKRVMALATRLTFLFKDKQWPPSNLYVCHTCDIPSCVNPSHLYLGTPTQNQRDRVARGRHFHAIKTHCKNNHEYDVILKDNNGRQIRKCSLCLKEYRKNWRKKQKNV